MAFIKFKPVTASFNFYSQINKEELTDSDLLYISQNEKIAYCFKSSRDIVILTDLRIILIDKKGFRAFRKTVTSISYKSISSFAMSIQNLDTKLEFILSSSHATSINFFKPIPIETMYEVYAFIINAINK